MSTDLSKLSDEQLLALEKQELERAAVSIPDNSSVDVSKLSNEELASLDQKQQALENQASLFNPDPSKRAEDILLSAAQGATAGYLPEVAGAIKSKSLFFGPEYEAARNEMKSRLSQVGSLESLGGQVAGSFANPIGLAAGALAKGAAPLARPAIAGLQSGLQSTGEKPLTRSDLEARIQNALLGAGVGAGFEGLPAAGAMLQSSAAKKAFEALRPVKRFTDKAMARDEIEALGRTALDEGVIGNIPRGPEALAKRAIEKSDVVGATKQSLIDEAQSSIDANLPEQVRLPILGSASPRRELDIPRSKIVDDVRAAIGLDARLPDAEVYNKSLDRFLGRFAKGQETITLKEADDLKKQVNKFIKDWDAQKAFSQQPELEQFNKQLYRALNKNVDEAAELVTERYLPQKVDDLKSLKKRYGSLEKIEDITTDRASRDLTNRMLSPSDYGAGAVGALKGAGTPESVALATAGAGINNFLRRYGNQLTAKQMDNLGKIMQSQELLSVAKQPVLSVAVPRSAEMTRRAVEELLKGSK